MIDLKFEQRIVIRNHFREWAITTVTDLGMTNCCVLLLDQRGYILEVYNNMKLSLHPEALSLFSLGACLLDSLNDDNAIIASIRSNQLEWHSMMPLFKNHRIQAATAAAPLLNSSDGLGAWFGFISLEPTCDIKVNYKALWHSFAKDLELSIERQNSERLSLLLDMGKAFHGRIDVNDILNEVINWMKTRFPIEQFDLLLSQDHTSLISPVKPLVIQHPDLDLSSRVFLEGKLLIEVKNEGTSEIYTKVAAPLKGKQGIYGILHANLSGQEIVEDEVAFISMLADNAGKAFEVAKLYEQSNSLIGELRIINEITKRLNKSLQLGEIFRFACDELIQIFAADYCCILQIDDERANLVVQASNAELLINEKFDIHYGFAGSICRSKEPLIISDYQHNNNNVESKLMNISQARSLIGSPIIINGETVGAILLVHRRANFFSYDNFKMLQVLSGHIGLAITNATLHSEMRRMVVTDQLTGLYVRHYLYEQIHLMQKKEYSGSLIVLDIDDFKKVNDNYGHQIGDQILIKVCSIISQNIRESDIAARWGGEEFAIYLPLMTQENAFKVTDRIRKHIYEETNPTVTISCGIASWNCEDDQIGVDHLFHKADIALYQAKKAGKNKIRMSNQ
ncbi:MAG: sensor domain-containing diguanylate cyclase [Paenibacillaceae bacterium]